MGLDTVELVIEVEESFGISIGDEDAPGIVTVGELFEYVLERVGSRPTLCLTSLAFYRLRRAIMRQCACAKQAVHPSVDVATFAPEQTRRKTWREMEAATGFRWPSLRRPKWLVTLVSMLAIDAGVQSFVLLTGRMPIVQCGAFAGGIFLAATFCAWKFTEPWAVEIAPECATVGGLSRQIVAKNYARLAAARWQGTRNETWESLVTIISEQLGVDRERVTPNARFVHDLGAD